MRVAFDLDGVLADLHTPFVRAAIRLFPELEVAAVEAGDPLGATSGTDEPRDEDVPPVLPGLNLTRRQSDAVWRHLASTENFWESLSEIESGAIAALAALADERRWEVLFITSRPRSTGRTVQRQSQRWLQAQGFPMPSVYVVHGSRGRVAAALALDVVVDDRADNCLDIVLESRAGALLVWRGAMAKVPVTAKHLGIAVVPTVGKAVEALVTAERAVDGGSMLDRLRRLFGLKTKSSPLVR
jgi:hypothetical protein